MKCVEVYKELYHQEPFDVAFCPYRISPLGAHIDHQYGKINGLAIDKGIHMAYHPKQNGVVELQSLNFPKRAQFFVNAVPEEKQGDWADHLRGAAKMLGEKYRLKVGLSGIIEGSLPIGGLSSSASVIICFLSALCKVNGIHLEPMEMILTAKAAENQYVGVACGKLDQSCEVLSKKNHLLYLDTKDDSYELIPTSEKMKPYKVAIFFSGLERSLKNSKYNLRQDECKAAAYALMGYAGMDYILGVEISAVNKETAIQYLLENMDKARGKYICACNVHTTVTAHENLDYQAVQNNSFMTLPDGKPLSSVGVRRGYSEMGRVTGPDFMEQVIAATEKSDARHYFYGTTQKNLNALLEYLKANYPQLSIVGCEPSLFRPLTIQEETELCDRINESKADFVWVALGAPRQEKFCAKLSKNTKAVWIAVGGAFNVISGVIPRAPQWMQDHSLEWLYRWSKEPKRLFKRYVETNSKFVFYLIREKVEKKE